MYSRTELEMKKELEKKREKEKVSIIEKIKKATTYYIGKEVLYYKTITSTHIVAQELAKEKSVENGTILIADNQTGGIGTKGRKWHTGNESNIAMTMVLYPKCEMGKLEGLTVKIAHTIQKAIKQLYGYDLEIKEPNDLMLKQKKIGGILTRNRDMP